MVNLQNELRTRNSGLSGYDLVEKTLNSEVTRSVVSLVILNTLGVVVVLFVR